MPMQKKKFQSGEGARYVTRRAALNKLQLSLKDFRTLCIIKGIYPREPAHRRRAQRGKSGIHILYLKKDILFLLHEPMIWKLRDLQIHLNRLRRAKGMHQKDLIKRYANTIPRVAIDHVVKERYPTFIDALRDMDDALTLCCLFSTFPKLKSIPPNLIALCRRLTVEFMHACIAARALRKVFISIKGIYFQVEFKGQPITWIIPHNYPHEPQKKQEVDFYTMATFADFYSTALGFVNFRLYHSLNLYYPPRLGSYNAETLETEILEENETSDRVAALNLPLLKTAEDVEDPADEELNLDAFALEGDETKAEEARKEYEKVRKLKKLFEGLKVFLNREVPREPLVFALRSFGAKVSWDETTFPEGATFPETDESITHQIVDRPDLEKQYISRYYIQPQWVFDCVNARELLPVEKYFLGTPLPPHLSPFTVEYRTQRYVPPEEKALTDPSVLVNKDQELLDEISDNDIEDIEDEKKESEDETMEADEDEDLDEFDGEMTEEKLAEIKRKKMKVESGTPEDKCSLNGAAEGVLFPRHLTPDMTFPIYRKAFCRTLPLTYNSTEQTSDGYPVFMYKFLPEVFNSSLDVNRCYCPADGCLPSGLSDISPCYYGEPSRDAAGVGDAARRADSDAPSSKSRFFHAGESSRDCEVIETRQYCASNAC